MGRQTAHWSQNARRRPSGRKKTPELRNTRSLFRRNTRSLCRTDTPKEMTSGLKLRAFGTKLGGNLGQCLGDFGGKSNKRGPPPALPSSPLFSLAPSPKPGWAGGLRGPWNWEVEERSERRFSERSLCRCGKTPNLGPPELANHQFFRNFPSTLTSNYPINFLHPYHNI